MVRVNIIRNVMTVVIIIKVIIKGKAQIQIENIPTNLKIVKTPTILSIQNGVIDIKMKKRKANLHLNKKKLLKRKDHP